MKKLLLLTLIIFAANVLSAAQNTTNDEFKELDAKIEEASKKLDNTACNTTPIKCDDKAKAEKQRLSDEYYKLVNERKAALINKQNAEKPFGDKIADNGLLMVLIIGVPVIFVAIAILILLTKSKYSNSSDSHGSASWSTNEELQQKGFFTSEVKSGNFLLGNQSKNLVVLPEEINFRHTAVLGPPGTGKSRYFFMPNLYYLKDKASVFVHDTKGELWESTAGHWSNALRFAPYDPDNSIPFNWIPYCTEENSLLTIDLAETIVTNGSESKASDSFWEDTEIALLAGMFSHVATTDCPTPAYCFDIITTFNLDQLIDLMRNSKSKFANEQANLVEDAPDRVKQAILTGVRRTLTWLRDEKVRRFTSATTEKADLNILRSEKVAVYWCLPQTYGERLRPLTCLALKLLMFQLRQTKGENVYLLLDEFDALGRIPRFESDLALLRSEKVAIVVGIQSISQLTQNYGKDTAQVIFDNLQTKITLHGLEYETAEKISKNLGDTTVIEDAVSRSKKGAFDIPTTSVSQRKHARRLMTADEIRRLDDSRALIITSNIKPFTVEKLLFNSDISPTMTFKCNEAMTQPVERKKQEKKPPPPSLSEFIS